jgi:hypothetical protein
MNTLEIGLHRLGALVQISRARLNVRMLLFSLVLLLGILARAWEFRSLPPGLNQDEAASGVDAFSLVHYGVDRNGVSFPVYFISYGSGQSAVDIYLLMPFVAAGGLSPFTVRLPVLIAGILSLPLAYLIGRQAVNATFGLFAMFMLAIAPWHILMSRWGHESNLLPFFFSVGFLLLLKSIEDNRWFAPAMAMMALCLYVYGPAYAAIPIFLALALPILLIARKLQPAYLIAGMLTFILMAVPIGLFMLVNNRHWDPIHLGALTIPRLPTKARYEIVSGLFKGDFIGRLSRQVKVLVSLLWTQTDHHPYNVVEPYGYLYPFTLPLAVLGAILLIPRRRDANWIGRLLLLAWLAAALVVGFLQLANFNRINLIFLPLTFCLAAFLTWIAAHSRVAATAAVVVLLAGFVLFTQAYHGDEYRMSVGREFFTGILPAVDYAARQGTGPICVTDKISEPQIFVLFAQQLDPNDYLPSVKYASPRGGFRPAQQLGRYTFGLDACANNAGTVYILSDEKPPAGNLPYKAVPFEQFTVYVPQQGSN